MIATHDSLTGYPVKYFLLKPFNFMAKCQSKDLMQQFEAGARSFDLRFAKHRGRWYAAHGAQIFNVTFPDVMDTLVKLSMKEAIYCRLICEDTFYKKSDWNELYRIFIKYLEDEWHGIKLLYVRSKKTWEGIDCEAVGETVNYDTYPMLGSDRKDLCLRVARMYELDTTDDKVNFIGCYDAGGEKRLWGFPYPKMAADALTSVALNWVKGNKENNCVVVDFL